MINFETECELQKLVFLFKYSVLDSRVTGPDVAAAAEVVLTSSFALPLLLVWVLLLAEALLKLVGTLFRDGNESKASPVIKVNNSIIQLNALIICSALLNFQVHNTAFTYFRGLKLEVILGPHEAQSRVSRVTSIKIGQIIQNFFPMFAGRIGLSSGPRV